MKPRNASPIWRSKIQKARIHRRGQKATPARKTQRTTGASRVSCLTGCLTDWDMASILRAARAGGITCLGGARGGSGRVASGASRERRGEANVPVDGVV